MGLEKKVLLLERQVEELYKETAKNRIEINELHELVTLLTKIMSSYKKELDRMIDDSVELL